MLHLYQESSEDQKSIALIRMTRARDDGRIELQRIDLEGSVTVGKYRRARDVWQAIDELDAA